MSPNTTPATPEDRGRAAIDAGIEALEANRRDEAVRCFDEALDHFEAIDDRNARREELGPFAGLVNQLFRRETLS